MTDTTYNGWTNYETWLVNLWLNECDIPLEQYTTEQSIKDLVNTYLDIDDVTGFAADMMEAALASVNWKELLEHF